MRKILASILFLGLFGCQQVPIDSEGTRTSNISFNVIQVEQTPISRTALSEVCTGLNYYRYTNGKLTNSLVQTSSDQGFGEFSDEMPWGTHELYFIGHKSEVTNFANSVATFDKVNDTFTHYQTFTVDGDTPKSQNFTLDRRVAKFELLVTDALPEWLGSVYFKITGGTKKINVKTGVGEAAMVQEKTIQIPAKDLGASEKKFSSFVFLPQGVDCIDVEVIAYDQEGEEQTSYLFEEVEVAVNYITRYKGKLFGKDAGFKLSVKAEWTDTNEHTF